MCAFFLEISLALGIEQRRRGIGKDAVRIAVGGVALRLYKNRPARTETAESVVKPCRHANQFRCNSGVQIWTAKACAALK